MSATRTISLAVLVVALGAAGAMAQNRNSFSLPNEEALNRIGLTRPWSGHAVANSTRDKVLHMSLDDDDRLYVQTSNSVLTCFDAESGKRLWSTRLGASETVPFPPSFTKDLAFCVQGITVYAIKKANGDLAWELTLPATPSTSPSSDDWRLYIGATDGCLYAFDHKMVGWLNDQGRMPQWSYQALLWRYRTNKPISSAAISTGRLAAFTSLNGTLYSVTTEDRQLIFQFETDAAVSAPMVRYRDWLLLASEDFNFYSVNIDNGRQGWQFPAGAAIRKAPVVIKDDVYIVPERGGMYRLNAATGVSQWWARSPEQFISASPDRVYTRDRSNNLVVLSRKTGAVLKTMSLGGFPYMMVNPKNDRIYVSTQGGLVMCLREKARPFPALHENIESRPIMPEFTPEWPEGEEPMAPPADAPPADAPATEAPADGTEPKTPPEM